MSGRNGKTRAARVTPTRARKPTTVVPYKFEVLPIVQELDAGGRVVAEHLLTEDNGRPTTVYGLDGLKSYAASFPKLLAAAATKPTERSSS